MPGAPAPIAAVNDVVRDAVVTARRLAPGSTGAAGRARILRTSDHRTAGTAARIVEPRQQTHERRLPLPIDRRAPRWHPAARSDRSRVTRRRWPRRGRTTLRYCTAARCLLSLPVSTSRGLRQDLEHAARCSDAALEHRVDVDRATRREHHAHRRDEEMNGGANPRTKNR